jgi:hypothetical protein
MAVVRQAEETRAAADEIVLAEVAEHQIAAAAAFHVVVAVGPRRGGRNRCRDVQRRRAVALETIVAKLSEDAVVARAAREVVVAEQTGGGRRRVIEERDIAPGDAVEVRLEARRNVCRAGGVVEGRAGESAGVARLVIDATDDRRVVAGDGVVAGVAVNDVGSVVPAGDVVTADQIIVVVAAADLICALAADGGVVAGVAADRVVVAKGGGRKGGREVDVRRQRAI